MTEARFIIPTKRKSLSGKNRAEVFRVNGGKCHFCGWLIRAYEKWEASHADGSLWSGGDDDLANLKPAHKRCHDYLTHKVEAPMRAKEKRIFTTTFNIDNGRKKRSRPIPGSKASGLKKHWDGSVSRREE